MFSSSVCKKSASYLVIAVLFLAFVSSVNAEIGPDYSAIDYTQTVLTPAGGGNYYVVFPELQLDTVHRISLYTSDSSFNFESELFTDYWATGSDDPAMVPYLENGLMYLWSTEIPELQAYVDNKVSTGLYSASSYSLYEFYDLATLGQSGLPQYQDPAYNPYLASVPEPATLFLLAAGSIWLSYRRRKLGIDQ